MLAGASAAYGFAVKMRAAAYDRGFFPARRAPGLSVISVGNIRAGGSGKTPLAMWIAEQSRDAGFETALILRGYRGRMERSGGVVSVGSGPLVGSDDAGDEAYLAAVRLERIQVRVGADRLRQAVSAAEAGAEVAVLDDGFQHRRLHRDLDVLLASPADLSPSASLLPEGPMRERPGAARRSDLMVGLASDWKDQSRRPPVLVNYEPVRLVDSNGAPGPIGRIDGLRAYLLSGIARPERFRRTAETAGIEVAGESRFGDHHRFSERELSDVWDRAGAVRADAVVTTEKDLARMRGVDARLPVLALKVDVSIARGEDLLKESIVRTISSGARRAPRPGSRPT